MGLIRGTQLFGHSIRMGGQSMKDWIRCLAIIWVVITVGILCIRIDAIHISHVTGELQANFYGRNDMIPLANRDATMQARNKYTKIMDYLKKDKDSALVNQIVTNYYKAEHIRANKLTDQEIKNMYRVILDSIWQALIPGIFISVGIFYLVASRGIKTKESQFIRGRQITESTNLNKMIRKANDKEKIKDSYEVAGILYPAYGEMEHLMISGTTGTGKTVILRNLINQIKAHGDKAIIYDYTGAFVQGFYDPAEDTLINPFDVRSKSWCLLKEVDNEAEFETIAEALIGGNESINDPFWPNGARLIFSELCKVQFRKKNFKTQDLYNHLLLPIKELNEILANTLAQNFTLPGSEKTTLSLLMLMTTYLKGLQHINNDGNDDFSIKKWLLNQDEKNILFLSSRSSLHNSIQPLISAMMDIAINNLGELPVGNKQKTWLIFDEVASLNYLPSLEKGLTVSRNFGGCFVIALQSISQLVKRYGHQGAETIASNCSSKIILKAGNNETAKWASVLLGTQEIEEYREGLSYGANQIRDGVNLAKNRNERFIALASEIISLPKFTGYALMTGGYPVSYINFEYLKNEKIVFNNPIYLPKSIPKIL